MSQGLFGAAKRALGGQSLSGDYYRLLRVHTLFLTFSKLSAVFINTLLLGQTQDVNVVLGYNAVYFASCAVTMLLATGVLHRLGPGVTAVLGIAGYNLLYLFLLLAGVQAARYALFLGLLIGVADGFYWLSYGCLFSGTTQLSNRDSGLAIISVCGSLVNLVAPLVSGGLISFVGGMRGYATVFGLALLVALLCAALALRLPNRLGRAAARPNHRQSLRLALRRPALRYALLAQGCKGIREGSFLFALGVVLYQLVSSEWLIGFNTFLSSLAAIASYMVISRVVTVARRVPLMAMAVVVLAVAAGLCLGLLSPLAVLAFSLVNACFAGYIENSCFTTFLDALQTVPGAEAHRAELLALNECTLASGRIVGLGMVALLFLGVGKAVSSQVLGLLLLTLTQFGTVLLCKKALAARRALEAAEK